MSNETHPPAEDPRYRPTPEPGVEPEGIDSPTLLVWGIVSVVLVVSVMFVAAALFFQYQNKLNQEVVVGKGYPESDKIRTDQLSVLTSYKAPDGEGQPYRIPIVDAKALVLDEYRQEASDADE